MKTFYKLESVIEIYTLLFISVLVVLQPGNCYHYNHDAVTFGKSEVASGKYLFHTSVSSFSKLLPLPSAAQHPQPLF